MDAREILLYLSGASNSTTPVLVASMFESTQESTVRPRRIQFTRSFKVYAVQRQNFAMRRGRHQIVQGWLESKQSSIRVEHMLKLDVALTTQGVPRSAHRKACPKASLLQLIDWSGEQC